MGLKILHTADWHLDSPLRSLPEQVARRLRSEARKIPGMVADICRREACDLVLLAGDVFDGDASRETVAEVKRALESCAVPVLIAPGNHDHWSASSVWAEDWPENVHIFSKEMEYVDFEDCRVYGAGFAGMDCSGLLENFQAEGEQPYRLAVLHGDPLSSGSPCCPVTSAQVRRSGLDYLALGHIHQMGSFWAGQTLCAWPGCPMGRGWDETGEKGLFLVELDRQAQLRWVSLPLPRFFDLQVNISAGAEPAVEAVLPPAYSEDFYRLTLTGRGTADTDALYKKYSFLPWLILRNETLPPRDLWQFAGEDSLRGAYFEALRSLSQDEETAEVACLAAEISAQLLDGEEVALP